jgi:hypothetical protein
LRNVFTVKLEKRLIFDTIANVCVPTHKAQFAIMNLHRFRRGGEDCRDTGD